MRFRSAFACPLLVAVLLLPAVSSGMAAELVAAPMNPANSGWASVGFDLNSG